jgi:hypothetical protein
MKKSLFIKVLVIMLAVMTAYSYFISQKPKVTYVPFATKSEGLELNKVESSKIMTGTPEGDLMIADAGGSDVFAKGGLNYVIAKEGEDNLFYSLCSTKIIYNKVNVVEGFDPKKDKLKIFCAHNEILPEAIRIIHDKFEGMPVTYVQIQGKHSLTAIALLGDIDIKVKDIILNERWVAPVVK